MNEAVDILVVDDNPTDAELIEHVLGRHGLGDRIHFLQDGAEALDFLFCQGEYAARDLASLPRMMLIDLRLPRIDGLEVLRRVKADPRTQAIPVVVFSSSWEESDKRIARDLGAHAYVLKPVDFVQFVDAVRSAIESGGDWK